MGGRRKRIASLDCILTVNQRSLFEQNHRQFSELEDTQRDFGNQK